MRVKSRKLGFSNEVQNDGCGCRKRSPHPDIAASLSFLLARLPFLDELFLDLGYRRLSAYEVAGSIVVTFM